MTPSGPGCAASNPQFEGLQRFDLCTEPRQPRHPGAVGAQLGPARAAQRQQHGIKPLPAVVWRSRSHLPKTCGAALQTLAAMTHVKPQRAARAGAATRRAAAARPLDRSERLAPSCPRRWPRRGHSPTREAASAPKRSSMGPMRSTSFGVSLHKCGHGLAVREVQAAFAGQQELAPDAGHGVEQIDGHAGLGDLLCGHQAGGPAADDGDSRTRRIVKWHGGRGRGADQARSVTRRRVRSTSAERPT